MTYMEWITRLPEVGQDLIAKARRVEALRAEAEQLEAEVCAAVNAAWSATERRRAKNALPPSRYDHDYEPGDYGVCRRCGGEKHLNAGRLRAAIDAA